MKRKGEKETYTHLNAEFQRTARREKKAVLSNQCKEIEENNKVGVTNRFKGLDLVERLKNYGWRFVTLYRRQ